MSLIRTTPQTPKKHAFPDLPSWNTFREAPGAEIQRIEDVSSLASGGGTAWQPGRKWDYKLRSVKNWVDLMGVRAPAQLVTVLKKPGMQERSWKPVMFARIEMPGGRVGYRLMYDDNWLRVVRRSLSPKKDEQLVRMMSGDTPYAFTFTSKTADILFGKI